MFHLLESLGVRTEKSIAGMRRRARLTRAVEGRRSLRLEPLEYRNLLTAINWDGGPTGTGTDWNLAANWVGDVLPGTDDDAVINVAGTITVTYAGGTTTVRSVSCEENLVISGGNFTVTTGSSVVNGTLTISGGSLTANGATATFTANGATSLSGCSLFASGGGQLDLSLANSYAESTSGGTTLQASGDGAILNLSGLTSITGGTSALAVNATSGGTVELGAVTTLTARQTAVFVDGTSSAVDLSSLANWSDAFLTSSLTVFNNGYVPVSAATTSMHGVVITLRTGGTIAGGTLQLNSNSWLKGTGTINANVVNSTLVTPGTSPGQITVVGNYTQNSTGILGVELNGLTPATQYDQLAVQGTVTLSGTLNISRGFVPSVDDTFIIIDNDGSGDPVSGTFTDAPEGEIYTINNIPFKLSYVGGDGNDVTLTRLDNTVVGRFLFYNQSGGGVTRYDHNDLAINSFDDGAIATDKTAYLWEDTVAATFGNVSSYTKGINGIMVDISGSHPSITASDFIFRVGNNNSPGTWATIGATSVSVRAGAGTGGSDRVEIIWTSGAPFKQWLEVITLANANTGLAQKVGYPVGQGDAFFFGNAPGNTGSGDSTANSLVNSTDEAGIRAHPALVGANIPITNIYDVNRSASVNSTDESAARLNGTNLSTTTKYINLTTAPAAPEADSGEVSPLVAGDSGVASALTSSALSGVDSGGVPKWLSNRLDNIDLNSGSPASLFQYLHDVSSPRSRALLQKFDAVADALGLDDTLLDLLLADLGLE